jgi:hypothetical protein
VIVPYTPAVTIPGRTVFTAMLEAMTFPGKVPALRFPGVKLVRLDPFPVREDTQLGAAPGPLL